jgi:hypothetical protein
MKETDRLDIERLGGFAGFGGGHLRSRGTVQGHELKAAEREHVAALFAGKGPIAPTLPDGFRYRLTLASSGQSVEVAEGAVPQSLRDRVQDELV